jgi:hypothetical protein
MALLYIHPPGVSILRRALSDGRRFPLELLPAKALASRRQARGCTSGAQYYYGSIAAIGMVMRQIFPAMTKVPFLQRLLRVVLGRTYTSCTEYSGKQALLTLLHSRT